MPSAALLSALLLCCHHQATVLGPHAPPNFLQVRAGLYRGGHPDEGALEYLRSLGVRTVVDLEIADLVEATQGQIDEESRLASSLGLRVVHVPISAFELGLSDRFDRLIDSAMVAIGDRSGWAVYVHCLHGQDRTGMVVGLERVEQEGWAPRAAWDEMVRIGFHPLFLGLREYFNRRTASSF